MVEFHENVHIAYDTFLHITQYTFQISNYTFHLLHILNADILFHLYTKPSALLISATQSQYTLHITQYNLYITH